MGISRSDSLLFYERIKTGSCNKNFAAMKNQCNALVWDGFILGTQIACLNLF